VDRGEVGQLVGGVDGEGVAVDVGDPGAVLEYGVRFIGMVPVPDDEAGSTVEFSGKVTARNDEAGTVTVTLTATSAGQKVLGKAIAVVRLS